MVTVNRLVVLVADGAISQDTRTLVATLTVASAFPLLEVAAAGLAIGHHCGEAAGGVAFINLLIRILRGRVGLLTGGLPGAVPLVP